MKSLLILVSLAILSSCSGQNDSAIADCVRYNADRLEKNEFDRRMQEYKNIDRRNNIINKELGFGGHDDSSPRAKREAEEYANELVPKLKKRCAENSELRI